MEIYRGRIDVLDYVFFATTERGKVYETGNFIHNYALTYALGLATASYAHEIQKPEYARDLAPLNEWRIYLTPARPVKILRRLTQWNTIQESYGLGKKPRDIGYPDWGFALVLRPESLFEFYLLLDDSSSVPDVPAFRNLLSAGIAYVRLGKFTAKARVSLIKAEQVSEKEGSFIAGTVSGRGDPARGEPIFLNWRDLSADPVVCEVVSGTLPTRLITNSRFEARHYVASFREDDQALLPAGMRFVARPL